MKFSKFYYLYSLVFVFLIPTLFESYFIWTHINKVNLLAFVIGITIIGSLWDIWATRHGSRDPIWLWQFNKKDTLGITLFDLPIEEYLFYIVTTVYIIFTWESINMVQTVPVLQWVIPAVTIWSLIFIAIPYIGGYKRDKF